MHPVVDLTDSVILFSFSPYIWTVHDGMTH